MAPTRRTFLSGLSAAALMGGMPRMVPFASAATTDYRALVCVFMYGGNDGNNMIVPTDTAGYAAYQAVRGDSTLGNGALGLPQSQLVALSPATGTQQFGMHPDLVALQPIWNARRMAAVFNLGTLVQPITKATYLARSQPVPNNLFSHLDQQTQWQTSIAQGQSLTGWGGRIADNLGAVGGASGLPVNIVASGAGLFAIGGTSAPLAIPASGGFGLNAFGGGSSSAVQSGLMQLLQNDRTNQMLMAAQDTVNSGIVTSKALSSILTSTSSTVSGLFAPLKTGIAQQLGQVARIIESRTSLGASRQIFFVSLGSFDTHTNQIARQSQLFQDMAAALKAFDDAMVQLGTSLQVTTFTLSDFARTLKPASGGGSDHAWGSHHLVMGGAVKGQSFYGTFPQLALGGPDDVSTEGRWLPTISVDQYAGTLAKWFGVPLAQLTSVFPNLANFGSATDLGFLA